MAVDPMQGIQTNIVAPAPVPGAVPPIAGQAPAAPAAPPQEEVATETLYIQNLNEKIKINGGADSTHFCALADSMLPCLQS